MVAKTTSNNTPLIEADVHCGGGTDAQPLTARIRAKEAGKHLNAWFEKGSSANHFRMLMVAEVEKDEDTVDDVAAWFKTNDGNTFEMILSYGTDAYRITGKKSLDRVRVILPSPIKTMASDICLKASTLETTTGCDNVADPALIDNLSFTGLSSGDFNTGRTLVDPEYDPEYN